MSEGAAETGAGPATGNGSASATGAAGTAPGDRDAAGLLDGMIEGQQQDDGEDVAAQLAHWKEMSRKHEKRAKENAAAAARLQQLEDANKSELQKALDRQAAAEHERDEALSSHARVMAAAANNLPVELIDHLGTGTDDEINERAALFAKVIEETAQAIAEQLIANAAARPNGNGNPAQQQAARPVESMRPGSAPAGATPNSNEQWFRQLLGNS